MSRTVRHLPDEVCLRSRSVVHLRCIHNESAPQSPLGIHARALLLFFEEKPYGSSQLIHVQGLAQQSKTRGLADWARGS